MDKPKLLMSTSSPSSGPNYRHIHHSTHKHLCFDSLSQSQASQKDVEDGPMQQVLLSPHSLILEQENHSILSHYQDYIATRQLKDHSLIECVG